MDLQTSEIVIKKILQNSEIKNSNVICKKQKGNIEIHIAKNPTEKDWILIEDIIANHKLKLRIEANLIIY